MVHPVYSRPQLFNLRAEYSTYILSPTTVFPEKVSLTQRYGEFAAFVKEIGVFSVLVKKYEVW
jgi:hypothetical protein